MKKVIYILIVFVVLAALASCSAPHSFGAPGQKYGNDELLPTDPPAPLTPTEEITEHADPTFFDPEITLIPTETPTPAPTATPVPDTEPPVISGVAPIVVAQYGTVAYKKTISLSDNSNGTVRLEVDASEVDLNTIGDYRISYTATDESGNQAIVFTTLTVREASVLEKQEAVEKAVDDLFAEILTDDMSMWTKVYKLWQWCRNNIKYTSDEGDMTNEYTGAYEGLINRKGDCYSYYATFKILLDKLGIDNLKCERKGGDSEHYWNLVNLGDGWYHCDCSPRRQGDTFYTFMQTDNQVKAYNHTYKERPNYYTCDWDAYPERSTTVIYDGWEHVKLQLNVKKTETEIQTAIEELKVLYPDGKYWNDGNSGVTDSPCHNNGGYDKCNYYYGVTSLLRDKSNYGYQCFGFASLVSDYIFGKTTAAYPHYSYEELRVGDHVRLDDYNPYCHSMIVIEKTDDHIVVVECNADYQTCIINWGREISRERLESDPNTIYYSRSWVQK